MVHFACYGIKTQGTFIKLEGFFVVAKIIEAKGYPHETQRII